VSRRTEKIGEELRSEIARLLLEETGDPRIGLVSVTRVDVAPDLSHALVFWSALSTAESGEEERARIEEGLASASAFLRGRLARALPLKRIPELRFRHDPSLALGDRTLRVLREISDGEKA
jgi:ribosome-binding factor A